MKKLLILFMILLFSFTIVSCGNSLIDNNKDDMKEYYKQPLGSDNDVYRVNITTENEEFPVDKENYIVGNLNITEQDTNKILHETMSMKVKLRGNSTIAAPKKPFKIKFDSKQSLFGLTAAKEWVLLANYYDKANIRNYLAYNVANKLNFGFQPSSIFVDVYFNNEYQGLYLLTEQMEANEGRVDIKNNVSSEGIKSFLLEADARVYEEYPGYEDKCFVTSGGYQFVLKYPDADDYVDAVNENDFATMFEFDNYIGWLKPFLNNVTDAISTSDYEIYSKYINVDSFVDYYIVQELFKNLDVANTSQYYVINQSDSEVKLSMGPVWDFDLSLGVVDKTSDEIYGLYMDIDLYVKERDPYYNYLFKDEVFKELVCKRYTEIRKDVIKPLIEEVEHIYEITKAAQVRDIEKWPLTQERNTWVEIYALSKNYYKISSLDGHYNHLKKVLKERIKLLDDNYLIK